MHKKTTNPKAETLGPIKPSKPREDVAMNGLVSTDGDHEGDAQILHPITDFLDPSINEGDDDLMIDALPTTTSLPDAFTTSAPIFPALTPNQAAGGKSTAKAEMRRIPIPPHRMTPLKKEWVSLFGPLTEILGLQVRMNVQRRCVEARVSLLACLASQRIEVLRGLTPNVGLARGRHQDIQKRLAPFRKVQILSRHLH